MVGDFTIVNLIAATTNAFNGALLARQPSHYRKYTILGVTLIAVGFGFSFHPAAVHRRWEEPLPWTPRNVPAGGEPEAATGQPVSTETP